MDVALSLQSVTCLLAFEDVRHLCSWHITDYRATAHTTTTVNSSTYESDASSRKHWPTWQARSTRSTWSAWPSRRRWPAWPSRRCWSAWPSRRCWSARPRWSTWPAWSTRSTRKGWLIYSTLFASYLYTFCCLYATYQRHFFADKGCSIKLLPKCT